MKNLNTKYYTPRRKERRRGEEEEKIQESEELWIKEMELLWKRKLGQRKNWNETDRMVDGK